MKVLLMDLDIIKQRRLFPNLALMKLSAYHKARGDEVYLNFPLRQPDITYASCVFTWNEKRVVTVPSGGILGGSGIDLKAELFPEVEHIMPDYSLYPGVDFSIGFTSRGCPRRCPWCIVPQKEGGIKPVARIYEFWDRRHPEIMLLDNNFLAAPNWPQTIADLLDENLEVDFRQGLDIRLVDAGVAWALAKLKTKMLRFAFDDIAYEGSVREGIEFLLARGRNSRKLSFYLLYGFRPGDKIVERLKILSTYKVDVYPMEYLDAQGNKPPRQFLDVADLPLLHGSRVNIKKFLRKAGRLHE